MRRTGLTLLALLLVLVGKTNAQDQPSSLLDLNALNLGRDSFAIQAQGRVIGFQRTELGRIDKGYVYREETQIGDRMGQSTFVVFDSLMTARIVTQAGQTQGKDTRIDITYANGRVKGDALVAGQPEFHEFAIDTTVAPGTIDDNALQPILPALPWSPGASWTLTIFSAGKNASEPATLAIKDTATVQVPAGTFATWRAELVSGVGGGVSFFITTDVPHRLVKVTVNGSPLEFVLVKEE